MSKQLYSLYDSKSETWSASPFAHNARGDAIRAFADAVNTKDQKSVLSAHPEDFTLFYVGDYDEKTGVVTSVDKVAVVNGVDVLIAPEPTSIEKHIARSGHKEPDFGE
jgi:hypothetical protein